MNWRERWAATDTRGALATVLSALYVLALFYAMLFVKEEDFNNLAATAAGVFLAAWLGVALGGMATKRLTDYKYASIKAGTSVPTGTEPESVAPTEPTYPLDRRTDSERLGSGSVQASPARPMELDD